MKFFVALMFGFCAVAYANPVHVGMVNTGHSAQFRSQDSLGNYAFGYNEDHATGGTFRRETGSPGMAHGSYGLRTIDGRVRVVNYVADGHGFRANIQTNEPGVEDQDPASVLINKAAAIVAPYINKNVAVPAPIGIQSSLEAPVIAKYDAPVLAEPAPLISGAIAGGPILAGKYEPAAAAPLLAEPAPATLLGKYEPAGPILEHGPAPIGPIESAPVLSSYTTKTYASPAPILSSDSVYQSLISGKDSGAYAPLQLGEAPILAGNGLSGLPHLKK